MIFRDSTRWVFGTSSILNNYSWWPWYQRWSFLSMALKWTVAPKNWSWKSFLQRYWWWNRQQRPWNRQQHCNHQLMSDTNTKEGLVTVECWIILNLCTYIPCSCPCAYGEVNRRLERWAPCLSVRRRPGGSGYPRRRWCSCWAPIWCQQTLPGCRLRCWSLRYSPPRCFPQPRRWTTRGRLRWAYGGGRRPAATGSKRSTPSYRILEAKMGNGLLVDISAMIFQNWFKIHSQPK